MPPGEGDYQVRVPKRYLFAAILLALTFVVLETGQRIADWRHVARRADRQGFHLETTSGVRIDDAPGPLALTLDPVLGYRLRPNQSAAGVVINSRGFRDQEHGPEKPDGTLRILVLGGSAVFGFKMPDDASVFTRRLERRLQEDAGTGRTVEVINAGVVGYASTQEVMLLATEFLDDKPDLVVVFDGWNDFWIAGNTPVRSPLRSPVFDQTEAAIIRGDHPGASLLQLSAFYRSLVRRVRKWGAPSAGRTASGDFGIFHDHPEALPLYRRNLDRLCRLAQAAGARVLIVPQPELFQRAGSVPAEETALRDDQKPGYAEYSRARYPLYVAAAQEIAATERAGFLDGTRIFDASTEPLFVDYVHFNARGHELVAEALRPLVEKTLGLAPRSD